MIKGSKQVVPPPKGRAMKIFKKKQEYVHVRKPVREEVVKPKYRVSVRQVADNSFAWDVKYWRSRYGSYHSVGDGYSGYADTKEEALKEGTRLYCELMKQEQWKKEVITFSPECDC